jgi:RNA polymerase sigma-70 factor (ECF subfamily)
VARWVAHLGGPLIEVDDAVQEIFVVAHRKLRALERHPNPAAWLFHVTANVVRGQRRSRRRQSWLLAHTTDLRRQAAELMRMNSAIPEELVRRENLLRLYAALDRMRERDRRLFVLFELEELSGEEICALTGLRLPGLWVALHRARHAFTRALAEVEDGARRGNAFFPNGVPRRSPRGSPGGSK